MPDHPPISTLPPSLLEKILLHLPAKHLLTRHRLICKSWTSLISTSPPLKYYTTTGTHQPTTQRQIRRYQSLYDFNPFFLIILNLLWKTLVPLWVKYKESECTEEEARKVNAALAGEVETLYLRYLYIFSVTPTIHPVYRETSRRISTTDWGQVQSRCRILLDHEMEEKMARIKTRLAAAELRQKGENAEQEKDAEIKDKEKFSIPSAFKYPTGDNPPKASEGFLIYLCRFMFAAVPSYSRGTSTYTTPPEEISTRLYMKVYCAPADKGSDHPATEGRMLTLMSYGSEGHEPAVSKFNVDGTPRYPYQR
ncbi:hypothetical protein TWF481_009801 [Arthrobotrys musiformis]|uniref:F-box domain-containing protein n=1 Tax=Arthrobotrys musiformis TaxID=47236 RepID=A0AAV9W4U5_9PEZI